MADWSPWVKGFVAITAAVRADVWSQPSGWFPGCCPGIQKRGDALGGCMGLGVSPATHLLLQSMQEVDSLWSIFCLAQSSSSQAMGRSYEETRMQTCAWTVGALLLSPLCHSPDSNSSTFMRTKGFCWWWWCLVKTINFKIKPSLSGSNCKSRGWKPNVSEYHFSYNSL